jgi:DnaJ family protein C protein 7
VGNDVKKIALKEKELGNQDFGKKKYESSLVHYSRAIQLNPNDPIFYTNRALVYLKLNRSLECIADCSASIHRFSLSLSLPALI